MEPQPKARAQTGLIKITGVGSWTKAWNLAEAEGDVTKFFHLGVKKFIIDADEASLNKRWRDHHGMKDAKWHEQLRKLELEQPLFHILVPTGKTKHWSPSTHKLIHACFWLQAMLNFSRALQKETSMNFLLGCWGLCGEPCLDVYCFFFYVRGGGFGVWMFPFQGRNYGMATPSKLLVEGIDVSHLSLWLTHWRSLKDVGVPPPPPGAAANRKAAPDDEEVKKKQRPALQTPTT